jgi:Di-haem oxidoreductase, putative peroxidase
MRTRNITHRRAFLAAGLFSICIASSPGQTIPAAWDEAALASMQTPLRNPDRTPKHMAAGVYNRLPVLTIYKTYPVYPPGREPTGYMERLRELEPEIVFDPAHLHTPADWAKAGEAIFDAPTFFENPAEALAGPQYYPAAGVPVATDGTYPFSRYVIRKKGEVELGGNSCAGCHTRVMADGSVLKGAQGNLPLERVLSVSLRALARQGTGDMMVAQFLKPLLRSLYAAPWITPDPYEKVARMSLEELAAAWSQVPAGVMTRDGSTFTASPQIPDLIGIRDRRYLNHTGTHLHRSVGDLMRYAALAQGAEAGSSWGDFRLVEDLPPFAVRYTDEALYALAQYLYALQPPANPNHSNAQSRAGRVVFEREGCGGCHTAPLYTNNRLMAVSEIGTDPELAMLSRRGTGFYKVPSLKGVWYRGPFGHGGTSPTLEDWLDAARLTGGATRKPAPGHEFGLRLAPRDKNALIAFLKTL